MKIGYNELPEVNQFIKENNLKPCIVEQRRGSLYSKSDDITYLVVYGGKTYISYNSHYSAQGEISVFNGELVICRGEIKE